MGMVNEAVAGRPAAGPVERLRVSPEQPSGSRDLTAVLRGVVAEWAAGGWTVRVDDVWAHAHGPAPMPTQGWKLHVSATVLSAERTLRVCAAVLLEAGCSFKVARDLMHVEMLTDPHCPRESSGKVLTAYPGNDALAVILAHRLDAASRDGEGPRILSDRPLRPGSRVHYRYGAFTGVSLVNHDGEVTSAIVAPDSTLVVDRREAGLVAPAWAIDPFASADTGASAAPTTSAGQGAPAGLGGPVAKVAPGRVLLGGRYAVREAIRHANRGGVFRATDVVTGRDVVVKQARAYVGTDRRGRDVRDRLRNEARVLELLADTGVVPELWGLFEQDGDLFIAEQDLGGSSLRSWVSAGMADGVMCRPTDETRRMLHGLALVVARAHEAGVVLRDLGPNNVVVTDDGRPVLVDLELAALVDDQEDAGIRGGTPAYSPTEQFDGCAPHPSADSYAFGATVLYAFTGEDPVLTAAGASTVVDWVNRGLHPHVLPDPAAVLAVAMCATEPAARATVMDAVEALGRSWPATSTLTPDRVVSLTLENLRSLEEAEADAAIAALVTRLLVDVRPERRQVAGRSVFGETTLAANVQHGAAGVLGVLVQAWRAVGGDDLLDRVDAVASWLERAVEGRSSDGPVGLYFGWSGPCWALADAGRALGDERMVERAVVHALGLRTDWPGPDVTHGIAGLGLTLAHLWQVTGDERLLTAVDGLARRLVAEAEGNGSDVRWRTPRTVASAFAGKSFYGYAHGTAGIATFLDHAHVLTHRDEFRAVAETAAGTLRRAAIHADGVVSWGSGPDEPGPGLPHWCNGSSGVATFLVRHREPSDQGLVHRASQAVMAAKWHSGVAYCHGLPGNADLLLDLADTLEGPYRPWAGDLLSVMWDRRSTDGGGVGLTDDWGRITPDFNVGYGGGLSALLRLRHGGPRLWLPEVTP